MNNQLADLRSELTSAFPERRDVVDGLLATIISGEHALLIGPPGSAKSALVRAIAQGFGGTYFEALLTRHTVPEELFGPLSLKALEKDEFRRITTGRLPETEFVFLDEIFKSNSSVLNSLLGILNERVFINAGQPQPCPLVSVIGASNELPEGRELGALFDRFALRMRVDYLIRENHFRAVMKGSEPTITSKMTMDDLRKVSWSAAQVKVGDDVIDAVVAVRDALKAEGLIASDRRWKRSLKLIQAAAYLDGQKVASPEDLSLLVDVLWNEPTDRPKVARVLGKLTDPVSAQAQEIVDSAREVAQKVAVLKAGDRKAYLSEAAAGLDIFKQQTRRLASLSKGAGRRARSTIDEVEKEISDMHSEMGRAVSQGLGLGGTP